jgi:hypothetical protein
MYSDAVHRDAATARPKTPVARKSSLEGCGPPKLNLCCRSVKEQAIHVKKIALVKSLLIGYNFD